MRGGALPASGPGLTRDASRSPVCHASRAGKGIQDRYGALREEPPSQLGQTFVTSRFRPGADALDMGPELTLAPVVARRLFGVPGVPGAGSFEQCLSSGRVEARVVARWEWHVRSRPSAARILVYERSRHVSSAAAIPKDSRLYHGIDRRCDQRGVDRLADERYLAAHCRTDLLA